MLLKIIKERLDLDPSQISDVLSQVCKQRTDRIVKPYGYILKVTNILKVGDITWTQDGPEAEITYKAWTQEPSDWPGQIFIINKLHNFGVLANTKYCTLLFTGQGKLENNIWKFDVCECTYQIDSNIILKTIIAHRLKRISDGRFIYACVGSHQCVNITSI